jgi:hypothetical protein
VAQVSSRGGGNHSFGPPTPPSEVVLTYQREFVGVYRSALSTLLRGSMSTLVEE